MAEEEKLRSPKRGKWLLWLGAALLAAGLATLAFLRSASFEAMLRQRVIAAVEQATGGRVELQKFSFQPGRLQVDLRGVTIHGLEGPQEPPLFSAELIQAGWKILSIWGLRADLQSVRIWKPQVYVVLHEDGGTNIPSPAAKALADRRSSGVQEETSAHNAPQNSDGTVWVQRMLALHIERLEGIRGLMHFRMPSEEKQLPLDFQAENFLLAVAYEPTAKRYAGTLQFENGLLNSRNVTPLRSRSRSKFALYSDRAELESFDWQTAGSRISVEGTMQDLASPRVDFRYDVVLDWKEAAELVGSSGWQGTMTWRGQGNYGAQGWQLQGPLRLRPAKKGIPSFVPIWWDAQAELRLLKAPSTGGPKSPFWVATLENLDVTALGGRLNGSGAVEMSSPTPITRFNVQANRISVPALLNAVSAQFAPFRKLRWAGSISGPVQGSFTGAGENLALHTDWRVDPPPVTPAGFIPVSGMLRGTYRAEQQRWQAEDITLHLPNASVAADGWLSDLESKLTVTAESARIEDSLSIVKLFWNQPETLPIQPRGHAQARFVWTGGIASPNLNGSLQLEAFDFRNARWDGLSGNFQYRGVRSRDGKAELSISSGRLLRGSAAIQFNGRAELREGTFTNASPFSVDASFRNVNVDELQELAGTHWPVQGMLQGSYRGSGTLDDPRGQATVMLTGGTAYGESFDRLAAQVTLAPGRAINAQQIRLQKGRGVIEGEASFGQEDRQYRFALTGSNLELESFRVLRIPNLPVTGVAQAKVSGSGNLSRPSAKAQIEIARFGVADRNDGKLSITLDAQEAQGKVQWTGTVFGGAVRGGGDVRLQDAFPFTARMEFANTNLASLMSVFRKPPASVQGQAGGVVSMEGGLRNLASLRLRGDLDTLTASVGTAEFRNIQPVRFRYESRLLQLEQLHLTGETTDLQAAGTVRLARDPALNLSAKGHFDLAALDMLDPELTASGEVPIDVTVSGTLGKPVWKGHLDFSDANVRYTGIPNGLTKIKGSLVFEGNHATFENFTAESGGGLVKLGGLVAYIPESGLEMQLAADVNNVRVRYPEGVNTWVGGRLTLTGSSRTSILAGNLIINKEAASPGFDVGAALVKRQQQPLVTGKAASLRNLRLDVRIVSATDVVLETTTAKNLRGDVDLRLRGTLERPALLGRISILQGEIIIGGRHYMADRGELSFSNPFRIEPALNLHVRARVEQYDISLDFTGPLDRLTVTYSSDPPLPTSEILSLLVARSAYGAARGPSSTAAVPELGASSLLSQALNQQMGSRLERIFGAGHIRIDPQIAGFGSSANAAVALEQHIKDNLTLLYITNVTSAQQQIIEAEVALSPRFSVAAVRDQNGLIGVNFQIRLRFR